MLSNRHLNESYFNESPLLMAIVAGDLNALQVVLDNNSAVDAFIQMTQKIKINSYKFFLKMRFSRASIEGNAFDIALKRENYAALQMMFTKALQIPGNLKYISNWFFDKDEFDIMPLQYLPSMQSLIAAIEISTESHAMFGEIINNDLVLCSLLCKAKKDMRPLIVALPECTYKDLLKQLIYADFIDAISVLLNIGVEAEARNNINCIVHDHYFLDNKPSASIRALELFEKYLNNYIVSETASDVFDVRRTSNRVHNFNPRMRISLL